MEKRAERLKYISVEMRGYGGIGIGLTSGRIVLRG
jgi:hypothetical protein